ncbi:hypothetical protein BG846_05370 [Streptomyces fradiae ATCC 10745 = DSM 40063]|uniref:Uncharacterized protein n=1 Tax=Streptomyces fradiae ATCC 10745 = DSM 40063 TaxID=1319510 RepID=A0A1Y2NPQ0_STRFR|nr:hypothetical protein BG846_05370 [Streptomyces fradiae ATCC 10745 = DSM 40063]
MPCCIGVSGYTSSTSRPSPTSRSTSACDSDTSGKSDGVAPPAPSVRQCPTSSVSSAANRSARPATVASSCTAVENAQSKTNRPSTT